MTYFIEGLSDTRIKKIQALGINLTTFPLEMSRRKDVKGHLIEEEKLDLVLKTIKADLVSKTPSTTEGVTIIKIKNKLKKDVTVEVSMNPNFYWDGHASQKRFRIACEELLDEIHPKVMFHCIHGKQFEPYKNDEFNIYFWASPSKEICGRSSQYFGFGLNEFIQDNVYRHDDNYIPIGDDKSLIPASFRDNHLYIHFDILHSGYESEELLFRKILSEYLILRKLTKDEIDSFLAERIKKMNETNKKEYVRICKNRFSKQAINKATENESIKLAIANLESQLFANYRDLKENLLFIDSVDEKTKTLEEKLLTEYEKIISMPKVHKVIINGNVVSFFTTNIECIDDRDGVVHDIGKFEIIIDFNLDPRGDKIIRFVNLTRQVGGYYHPHIPNNGHACQGTLSHSLPKLLADLEIEIVLLMCIQFLESSNVNDSWGKKINTWPVKKVEEKKSEMPNVVEVA